MYINRKRERLVCGDRVYEYMRIYRIRTSYYRHVRLKIFR